jgi:hypothetical protein
MFWLLGVVGIVTRVVRGQQGEELGWAARRHGEAWKVRSREGHPQAQSSLVGHESRRVAVRCRGVLGSTGYIGMRVEEGNGWRMR